MVDEINSSSGNKVVVVAETAPKTTSTITCKVRRKSFTLIGAIKAIAVIISTASLICIILSQQTAECKLSFRSALKRPTWSLFQRGRNAISRAYGRVLSHVSPALPLPGIPLMPPLYRVNPTEADSDEPTVSSSGPQQPSAYANDSINSKCFFKRANSLRSGPSLHFYSSRTHSLKSLGCSTEHSIDLSVKDPSQEATTTTATTITTTSDETETDTETELEPELDLDEEDLKADLIDSHLYDPNQVTYFILHGFMSSWNKNTWLCDAKDMLLNSSTGNVFIVDWSGGSNPAIVGDYDSAVAGTKLVAELISSFIKSIMRLSGQQDASKFHIIGHSLGAHIAGYIGYTVPNLGRITALDPAGPCFAGGSDAPNASLTGHIGHGRRRLSPESAQLVVALHTDTAIFGLNENCAHYDVYVNGGYKHPQCGSIDLVSKVNDFFDLDAKQLLNPNIVCAHSFAHELIDTFMAMFHGITGAKPRKPLLNGATMSTYRDLVRADLSNPDRCYPMAFRCDSWEAFLLGECGSCDSDRTSDCVYIGLTFDPIWSEPVRPVYHSSDLNSDAPRLRDKSRNDDDKFNDEDDSITGWPNPTRPSDAHALGRHFMKSGPRDPVTCLYQYQAIVATMQMDDDNATKTAYFYLHIPLDKSGRLSNESGDRLHNRLLQVSHKLEPGSLPYKRVEQRFSGLVSRYGALNFYTALITFAVAPESKCKADNETLAVAGNRWQLCRPLARPLEAQVWAASEAHVGSVRFAALNYMSGMDAQTRSMHSQVWDRTDEQQVQSRDQVHNAAGLRELVPSGNHKNPIIRAAVIGTKCLFSLFNPNSAATSFKCTRCSDYLKYAVSLKPTTLDTTTMTA